MNKEIKYLEELIFKTELKKKHYNKEIYECEDCDVIHVENLCNKIKNVELEIEILNNIISIVKQRYEI